MEVSQSTSNIKPTLFVLVIERIRKLPPAVLALLIQLLAFAGLFLVIPAIHHFVSIDFSLMQLTICQGLLALSLSLLIRFASWWYVIQFSLAPALVSTQYLNIPPIWFLSGFVLLAMIYWNTFRTQVPLYLSSRKAWLAINELLPDEPGFSFVDLGSGLGGLLAYLNEVRPGGHFHGVESAPLPFFFSWLKARLNGNGFHVTWGDFWKLNFADYDVVYAYLSPIPMTNLWCKARSEMRPGSLFISNTFVVPGVKPNKVVSLKDLNDSTLYIWQM